MKKTHSPIRLVIAEGRALFCETMKVVLDAEPDMCVQAFAHEGHSALVLSEELKPDVLVLDGNLPNGDSLQMTTALKKTPVGRAQNVLCKLQVHSRVEVIEFVRRHQPLPSPLGVMS